MDTGLKLSKIPFLSCLEVVKILKNRNVAFLDIRDRKKYVRNFAFGAINCPLDRFQFIINDLVPDKKTFVIIIGANNKEIKVVYSILIKRKFINIYFVKNNYRDWNKNQLPCWSGEFTLCKAFGEWIEATGTVKNIQPKNLKKLHLNNPNNFLQIDARPKKEYELFTLPFSKHCSGGEIPAYLNIKKPKKTIIVHCAGRTRSIIAFQTLIDFNFQNKKLVLNGGTQNWVLHGFERLIKAKSNLAENKLDHKKDYLLAKTIAKKFKLPIEKNNCNIKNSYAFIIKPEIIKNKNYTIWKNVNATTLIQNTDKFIAAISTKIYIYSEIATSAVFTCIWLNRMGYQAIWHVKKPVTKQIKQYCKKDFTDPTYFFAKRHLNSKRDAKGYLNWEHSLIPTLQKWGCHNPWNSVKNKKIINSKHPMHKIYSLFDN